MPVAVHTYLYKHAAWIVSDSPEGVYGHKLKYSFGNIHPEIRVSQGTHELGLKVAPKARSGNSNSK